MTLISSEIRLFGNIGDIKLCAGYILLGSCWFLILHIDVLLQIVSLCTVYACGFWTHLLLLLMTDCETFRTVSCHDIRELHSISLWPSTLYEILSHWWGLLLLGWDDMSLLLLEVIVVNSGRWLDLSTYNWLSTWYYLIDSIVIVSRWWWWIEWVSKFISHHKCILWHIYHHLVLLWLFRLI